MATGLLVIRLSRPFAAKSAANWVMKRVVFFTHFHLSKIKAATECMDAGLSSLNLPCAISGDRKMFILSTANTKPYPKTP